MRRDLDSLRGDWQNDSLNGANPSVSACLGLGIGLEGTVLHRSSAPIVARVPTLCSLWQQLWSRQMRVLPHLICSKRKPDWISPTYPLRVKCSKSGKTSSNESSDEALL